VKALVKASLSARASLLASVWSPLGARWLLSLSLSLSQSRSRSA
jgi:hypothetical protein